MVFRPTHRVDYRVDGQIVRTWFVKVKPNPFAIWTTVDDFAAAFGYHNEDSPPLFGINVAGDWRYLLADLEIAAAGDLVVRRLDPGPDPVEVGKWMQRSSD